MATLTMACCKFALKRQGRSFVAMTKSIFAGTVQKKAKPVKTGNILTLLALVGIPILNHYGF